MLKLKPGASALLVLLLVSLPATVLVACGGSGAPEVTMTPSSTEGVLRATIRVGDAAPMIFDADEVEASIGPTARGRELVIYARSYDFNETLALVINLNTATFPGGVELSSHGVLYHEPGVGVGNGDLFFDGVPQGVLELDGIPVQGSSVSGRFSFTISGYDTLHPYDEISAAIDGTLLLPVIGHSS